MSNKDQIRIKSPIGSAMNNGLVRNGNIDIDKGLELQQNHDLMRLITCGSVDDGKSTLIGRLLWESNQLFDDQKLALEADSKKYGTQGVDIDFALLVDGLSAEREQGITIDVAYRFFTTSKRKFIIADTPGHEQYTRNMVTGASTADLAILLVDAIKGIQLQTRRHAYIASLLGIRHIIIAINKMDLVNFKESVYKKISDEFKKFSEDFNFSTIAIIPISALNGDNVIEQSPNMPWYRDLSLFQYLETIQFKGQVSTKSVFPVQLVNRPNPSFRGYSGTVAQGIFKIGDEICVNISGQRAKIQEIISMNRSLESVVAGDSITLCLDRDIDASRGDIITLAHTPLEVTDEFEAKIVWLNHDDGLPGRNYNLKLSSQWTNASITEIKYLTNVNTFSKEKAKRLQTNDISTCNLFLSKPIVFDSYEQNKNLGSFILVDKQSNATVAAGMINHSLRRAQNVHKQDLTIHREERARIKGHRGMVIWFTGLSGSGKSTLANALEIRLHKEGIHTYILDGDNIRQGLNRDLGFSEADRVENIRRIAEVSKLMIDAGLVVITAFISPYIVDRMMSRDLVGANNFFEIYVDTPIEVCEKRDVKGLYKLARSGKIPNMTGINSPYEPPLSADFIARTENKSIDENIKEIIEAINIV